MEYDVIFFPAVENPAEAVAARLIRLAPESPALILQFKEPNERLLLGDVRKVAPEALPVLSEGESSLLGIIQTAGAELSEDVTVLCRMGVPYARPQDAGFDLSRLILVCEGKALEISRPGAPIVPLVVKR